MEIEVIQKTTSKDLLFINKALSNYENTKEIFWLQTYDLIIYSNLNSDSKKANANLVCQIYIFFLWGSQQKDKCPPKYISNIYTLTARNIIIRGLKKEGSKEKIPTYFAANQSNKDQTKQTPACSSKHLALGHQTIDFQTEKKEKQKTFNMSFFLDPWAILLGFMC